MPTLNFSSRKPVRGKLKIIQKSYTSTPWIMEYIGDSNQGVPFWLDSWRSADRKANSVPPILFQTLARSVLAGGKRGQSPLSTTFRGVKPRNCYFTIFFEV